MIGGWCRYTKQADWDYISQCATSAPGLQLIGNGDIMSYTDYNEHMQACPDLATTMLARGALIKPWLFTEVLAWDGEHVLHAQTPYQHGVCTPSWRPSRCCGPLDMYRAQVLLNSSIGRRMDLCVGFCAAGLLHWGMEMPWLFLSTKISKMHVSAAGLSACG